MADFLDPDEFPHIGPGARLAAILQATLMDSRDYPREQIFDHADRSADVGAFPRYLSRLQQLDHRCGGFYGMTVVKGVPGVGKSELALGAGIEAALPEEPDTVRGWRVIYVNAELSVMECRGRFNQVASGFEGEQALQSVARLHVMHADVGTSDPLTLRRFIDTKLDLDDERLLIIIDSINSLAKLWSFCNRDDGETGYFRALESYLLWAKESVRFSEGRIAWLMIAELGRTGSMRGSASADFWANIVLRLKAGKQEHEVLPFVEKGRQGGRGKLEALVLDWRRGLFVNPSGLSPNLRVVGDEEPF